MTPFNHQKKQKYIGDSFSIHPLIRPDHRVVQCYEPALLLLGRYMVRQTGWRESHGRKIFHLRIN